MTEPEFNASGAALILVAISMTAIYLAARGFLYAMDQPNFYEWLSACCA